MFWNIQLIQNIIQLRKDLKLYEIKWLVIDSKIGKIWKDTDTHSLVIWKSNAKKLIDQDLVTMEQ